MPTLIDETCSFCKKPFKITLKLFNLNKKRGLYNNYCSIDCANKGHNTRIEILCKQCNKPIIIQQHLNDGKNRFCSKSCAATYNNTHKKHGYRRSKMELWIEEKIKQNYSDLIVDYNKTTAIGSELDIFIPSLKLAIELNGIFHYEPVYGETKLMSTKFNDANKYKKCHELGISLCVIDTSKMKYFKEINLLPYWNIIDNIINENVIYYSLIS